MVTEKIDGTNVRIRLDRLTEDGSVQDVSYGGRTDDAQMPVTLFDALRARFPLSVVAAAFDPGTKAVIFGEGYGPKIQKGGGDYAAAVSFRVFDVVVFGKELRPWWLNWADVVSVASKIGAETVPVLGVGVSLSEAVGLVLRESTVARLEKQSDSGRMQEGIVCRTEPLLFARTGRRVMWKLKNRDFEGGR